MKKRMPGKMIISLLFAMLLLPYVFALGVRAQEAVRTGRLVIEVIEDIPAEDVVTISEGAVPLAAGPQISHPFAPYSIIWVFPVAVLVFFRIKHTRQRARLLRIRREGYRIEESALNERRRRGIM